MFNMAELNGKWAVKLIWGIVVMVSITFLVLYAANDMILKLTDAAGTGKFAIQDSAASDVFRVDSDGNTEVLKGAEVRIYEGASTYKTGFSAPVALASNAMYKLPTNSGNSGQLLTSNGSGTLSWSTVTTAPRNLDKKWFVVNSAGAAMAAVGIAAPSTQGTFSNVNDTDSTYVSIVSAAVTNSNAGITSSTYTLVQKRHSPYFSATIRTGSSIDNMRILVGLLSALPANNDDPGGSVILFRYASAVSGNWYACSRDGTTLNAVSTGLAVATSTEYNMEITVNYAADTAEFKINGTVYNTIKTTNLPAASTDLGFIVRVQTTEAVAKTLKISRVYCDFD